MSLRGAPVPGAVDLSLIRAAIREARKLRIEYVDANGAASTRTVRPIAVEYYVEATLLCAWCELRDDYRHFRADRILGALTLNEGFGAEAAALLAGWEALTRAGSA